MDTDSIPLRRRWKRWWYRKRNFFTSFRFFSPVWYWELLSDAVDHRRGRKEFDAARKGFAVAAERGGVSPVFRLPRFLRHRVFLLTLLLVVVACAAAFRPAYRWFREWRTDVLLQRGAGELARREWSAAESTARGVLLARKEDLSAVWLLFRSRRGMGSVNALEPAFWLAMQPGITGDEKYEILNFMVDSCPAGAFATTFHRLSLAEQEPPRFQALLARFLTRRGSLKPAGEILAAAREKDTDINLLRERARLACRIGTPEKLSEAWECFRKLDGLDKVEALSVLRMIVMAPGRLLPSGLGVPSQLDEWLSAIPGTTTDDRLMAFDGKLAAGEPLGTVSAEVMDKFAAAHPVETVRWLSRHGRHDEVLQLAATPGLEPSATYAALVEAQIARGFYSIATGTLSNPPPKFDPTDLAFLRIRLAEASRDPDPKPWEDAIKQVSRLGDGTRALELAELAASLHRGPQKQDAIAAACRQPGGPLPLFRDILPILGSLGKQDRIFELTAILANLRRFEAGDPLLMKAFLYIKCLNGDLAPSEVLPSLRDLCGRESSDDNTIALAFTLLLSGECREPVLLLEPIERHTGNNKLLEALLGTALRLCGRAEEGKRFLSRVQWDSGQMLPIEERCIKRLLAPVEAREAAEAAARAAAAAEAGATVTEDSTPGDDAAAPAGAKQSP